MKSKYNKHIHQSGVAHLALVIILVVGLVGALGVVGYKSFGRRAANNLAHTADGQLASDQLLQTNEAKLGEVLSIDDVVKKAAELDNSGDIAGIELESHDEKLIYVVHYTNKHRVLIDAVSGAKITLTDNDNDDIDEEAAVAIDPKEVITPAKAVEIAKTAAPNSALKKLELENEDGTLVYKVKFVGGTKVLVNAKTGQVIKVKQKKQQSQKTEKTKNTSDSNKSSKKSSSEDKTDDDSDDKKKDNEHNQTDDDSDDEDEDNKGSDDDEEDDEEDDENDDSDEDDDDADEEKEDDDK